MNKETHTLQLNPKPITNQLLWDISKLIVSRINTAKGETLGKFEIDTLESDWFDYLEETLTIVDLNTITNG